MTRRAPSISPYPLATSNRIDNKGKMTVGA
jgi:hypothetical protein